MQVRACAEGLIGLAETVTSEAPAASVVDDLLGEVRLLQRRAAGVVTALTTVALANQRAGTGPIAEEVLGGGGTVGRADARGEVERARVASQFPAVGEGIAEGAVHTGNVDVLARLTSRMTDDEIDVLAKQDTRITDAAARLSEDSFRKRVQRMRDKLRDDHGKTAAEQAVADSFARVSLAKDRSSYRLAGELDPLRGAAVQAALGREYRWLSKQPELLGDMDADQAMAQALHDLILRGDSVDRETGSTRANVSMLVLTDRQTLEAGPHAETVAETDDGATLDPATVGRLCCDAGLRRLDVLPDAKAHVSHSGRTASPSQRAALRAMYSGCPISAAPWSQCEVHHTIFYNESGRTVLSELVPISKRWHHLVHEGGWILTMDTDRTLTLSQPDGTVHRTIPYSQAHRPTGSQPDHVLAA